jgi:hypothetical protein
MSEESKGIKESLELLEGVKLIAVAAKRVGADGKVGMDDLKELINLAQNVGVLAAAAQGVGEVKSEVKDLSAEELQALGAKVLEIVNAVRAA